MDFSVNINEDGSMQVVELWDMYINKGSTVYKETSKISAKVNRIQRFKDITNSNYSSGEGYGGGFSDGDAGGGRRWRIRCKIN